MAFPRKLSHPALDDFQLSALRGILAGVRAIADRPTSTTTSLPDTEFRALKRRKHALERCALAFNAKPKEVGV